MRDQFHTASTTCSLSAPAVSQLRSSQSLWAGEPGGVAESESLAKPGHWSPVVLAAAEDGVVVVEAPLKL